MAWSYSGDPSTSQKDEVRFLVGDTDTNDPLVSDEEINYAISTEGGAIQAAVTLCRAIAAKFSRQADKEVGGTLRISLSQKAKAYLDLAARLQKRANIFADPYAGGLLVSEKAALMTNTDLVQPIFRKGMMSDG